MLEVEIIVPDNTTAFGMAIWCGVHLTRKLELDFENGLAKFTNEDDAKAFEKEWNNG